MQPYEPSLNYTTITRLFNDDNPGGSNHPQQCQTSKKHVPCQLHQNCQISAVLDWQQMMQAIN